MNITITPTTPKPLPGLKAARVAVQLAAYAVAIYSILGLLTAGYLITHTVTHATTFGPDTVDHPFAELGFGVGIASLLTACMAAAAIAYINLRVDQIEKVQS